MFRGSAWVRIENTPVRVENTINFSLVYPPGKNVARDQGLGCYVLSHLDQRGVSSYTWQPFLPAQS